MRWGEAEGLERAEAGEAYRCEKTQAGPREDGDHNIVKLKKVERAAYGSLVLFQEGGGGEFLLRRGLLRDYLATHLAQSVRLVYHSRIR